MLSTLARLIQCGRLDPVSMYIDSPASGIGNHCGSVVQYRLVVMMCIVITPRSIDRCTLLVGRLAGVGRQKIHNNDYSVLV